MHRGKCQCHKSWPVRPGPLLCMSAHKLLSPRRCVSLANSSDAIKLPVLLLNAPELLPEIPHTNFRHPDSNLFGTFGECFLSAPQISNLVHLKLTLTHTHGWVGKGAPDNITVAPEALCLDKLGPISKSINCSQEAEVWWTRSLATASEGNDHEGGGGGG